MVPNYKLPVITGVSILMKMMNCRGMALFWFDYGDALMFCDCGPSVGYWQYAKWARFDMHRLEIIDMILRL